MPPVNLEWQRHKIIIMKLCNAKFSAVGRMAEKKSTDFYATRLYVERPFELTLNLYNVKAIIVPHRII